LLSIIKGDFLKLKGTKSLCPECGKTLEAEVFEEDGKVYIKKLVMSMESL
jgi:uncharacterized radical SAM superfamily Fe-S cluster-containing enzyme